MFSAIIKLITATTIHCTGLVWPTTANGGQLNFIVFMTFACLTLYNFLSSIYQGPGYLPPNWSPVSDAHRPFLQFCTVCNGYKAPRAHHCRKCDRCILKMDHHCPWINNCVGWGNHAHFACFLAFAVLGCLHAATILSLTIYELVMRTGRNAGRLPSYCAFVCIVTALGFCVGIVIAVGILLYFQIKGILRNETGIEEWIIEKAIHNRKGTDEVFLYPYNLGIWRNVRQVLNASCQPIGDGIVWPILPQCDQYTLTREQQEQKLIKRQRAKMYQVIHSASGAWLPLRHGVATLCCPPCTDESRIELKVGDQVLVTRWHRHWLFGDKLSAKNSTMDRVRGWFPRRCVKLLSSETDDFNKTHQE